MVKISVKVHCFIIAIKYQVTADNFTWEFNRDQIEMISTHTVTIHKVHTVSTRFSNILILYNWAIRTWSKNIMHLLWSHSTHDQCGIWKGNLLVTAYPFPPPLVHFIHSNEIIKILPHWSDPPHPNDPIEMTLKYHTDNGFQSMRNEQLVPKQLVVT